jgi:hypothetical protein
VTEGAASRTPLEPIEQDRTRPLGVALLAAFQVLNVALNLAAVAGVAGPRTGTLTALLGTDSRLLDGVFVGLGILSLAAAVGLWRLHPLGWYAVMLLTGLGLALQIVFYVWATPNFPNLAIYVVSAFYLNQREVKEIFLAPRAAEVSVILSVEEDDRR